MNAPIVELTDPVSCPDPIAKLRLRAAADARFLLSLARAARADGLPKSELRAANALSAARKVVNHARFSSLARHPAKSCDRLFADRTESFDEAYETVPLVLLAIPASVPDSTYAQSV